MYCGVEVAEVVLGDFVDQDVTCAAFDRDCVGRVDADFWFVAVFRLCGVRIVFVGDGASRGRGTNIGSFRGTDGGTKDF